MTYDLATEAAANLMLGHSLTTHPTDNKRAVLAIRAGIPRAIVLRKRAMFRDWLTLTQRKWQRETRRPSRANHHDSVAIREKWVRCSSLK